MTARARRPVWAETLDCALKYATARREAQAAANADGFDRGLERNDLDKSFCFRIIPQRKNRYGYDLLCEVVSCEDISRCRPGHGPAAG